MASEKIDRRQKRSKAAFAAAFRELLIEKEFSRITVKEIAERADRDRKTFYLHYESIDDLVDELLKDEIERIVNAIGAASLDDGGEISVSNLVRTATLTPGDTINAYDATTKKYKAWTLSDEKVWEPTPVIGGSGESEAGAYTVPRGAGVWLTRSDTSKPLYLVGGTSAGAVETAIEPSVGDKPAWNLVASPSVEPVNLSTLLSGKEEQAGVVVPTAGAPKTYTFKGDAWGYDTTVPVMKDGKQVGVRSVRKTDDVTVPAGTGFWYLNSSSDVKIKW